MNSNSLEDIVNLSWESLLQIVLIIALSWAFIAVVKHVWIEAWPIGQPCRCKRYVSPVLLNSYFECWHLIVIIFRKVFRRYIFEQRVLFVLAIQLDEHVTAISWREQQRGFGRDGNAIGQRNAVHRNSVHGNGIVGLTAVVGTAQPDVGNALMIRCGVNNSPSFELILADGERGRMLAVERQLRLRSID